jgi:hypothetical protein
VTIDGNEVTITGKKSKYLFDVSPEKIGYYVPNILGRYPVPEISDFFYKFN